MNSPVLAACAVLFFSLVAVASWSQDDAVAAVSSPTASRVQTAAAVTDLDRRGYPIRVVLPSPF